MASFGSSSTSAHSGGLSKTLIIVLSSVLSVIGVVFFAWLFFFLTRYRTNGKRLFPRGITPIDDDEIQAWKGRHPDDEGGEKEIAAYGSETIAGSGDTPNSPRSPVPGPGTGMAGASMQRMHGPPPTLLNKTRSRAASLDGPVMQQHQEQQSQHQQYQGHQTHTRARRSSNVIVYTEPPSAGSSATALRRPYSSGNGASAVAATPAGIAAVRWSEEFSPRSVRSASFGNHGGRSGFLARLSSDQDRESVLMHPSQTLVSPLVPTALQHACAPNARAGLTDDVVPGDPSFLPTPRRHQSRLMKPPPSSGSIDAPVASVASPAPTYAPRRRSSSLANSASHASLASSPSTTSYPQSSMTSAPTSNSHPRTRSTRSTSIASVRSCAGSDVALTPPHPLPHALVSQAYQMQQTYQNRPSGPGILYGHAQPPTSSKQPSVSHTSVPVLGASLSIASLHKDLPAPPPPPPPGRARAASNSRRQTSDFRLDVRSSSTSMYRDYLAEATTGDSEGLLSRS